MKNFDYISIFKNLLQRMRLSFEWSKRIYFEQIEYIAQVVYSNLYHRRFKDRNET